MSIFKKFMSNEDGNFAIMFSVGATALGVALAVAVDMAGLTNASQKLQNNIDSAAMSAVIEVANAELEISDNRTTHEQYEQAVLAALTASGLDLRGMTPIISLDGESLTVQIQKPYDLSFGGFINKPSTNISALSKVALPGSGAPAEIALVLDNTHSMTVDGKMTALRQGAREFIDTIEQTNSGSKIALVPFARYVDVGMDKVAEPWLEVPVEFDTDVTWQQATHSGGTCNIETDTRFNDGIEESFETEVCTGQTTTYETKTYVAESRWLGCVGVRSNGLHMLDDSYTTIDTRIQGLLHKVPTEVTGFSFREESWCPHTITPLTDDFDLLDQQMGELYGTDRTYIPAGLIWGQRILSPKAPFAEADTVNPKRQIMVLMSDGDNTGYLQDGDDHESIPYVQDLSRQEQEDGDITVETNEDTLTLCESIKAEGIEIFTIAFQVKNDLTKNLLLDCASSPSNYFDAGTNQSLVETFQAISQSLETEIRLMR